MNVSLLYFSIKNNPISFSKDVFYAKYNKFMFSKNQIEKNIFYPIKGKLVEISNLILGFFYNMTCAFL